MRTALRVAVLAIVCATGLPDLAAASGPAMAEASPSAAALAATWEGTLETGGPRLRLALHLTARPGGGWTATIDSLDQGARGIPVDRAVVEDGKVTLELRALAAGYTGTLNAERTEMAGTWSQGGTRLPLVFKAVAVVAVPRRPQDPARPYPYREEEVTVRNESAGVTLAGTLTLPPGSGPFPAVLLITGSGPQDRDETVFGHRPFLVLADHLTRRGVAVLRLDDRGVGGSTRGAAGATTLDFAADALAAVAFLAARPGIDAARVGLLGHSEGAIVAPLVAARSRDVAFVVMLAGPGVPGEQILLAQSELLLRAAGAPEAAIARARAANEKVYATLRQEADAAKAEARVREILRAEAPEMPAAALDGQVRAVVSPWFRFFLTYDPRPALARVTVPVLALWGERDLQVPPGQNAEVVRAALAGSGNRDVTVKVLPGLNHLFQECTTGAVTEYATIEQTIAPAALDTVAAWIVARGGAGGK